MTDHQKLYNGISKAAWAYFFFYFDINLGNVNILPDFVAFLLFLAVIRLLREEERDLALLEPLGILLAVWHGICWILELFGGDLGGLRLVLNLIASLANIYFHFQLLTDLASLAEKYQPEDEDIKGQLLRLRTGQTVMLTCMIILSNLSGLFGKVWSYLSLIPGLAYVIAGTCLIRALFRFRKIFLKPTCSRPE